MILVRLQPPTLFAMGSASMMTGPMLNRPIANRSSELSVSTPTLLVSMDHRFRRDPTPW